MTETRTVTDTETITLTINPNGSFAHWQITEREGYETFGVKKSKDINDKDIEPGETVTIKIPKADMGGYNFQYNGHTAFLLDFIKDDYWESGALKIRNNEEAHGLNLINQPDEIPIIQFNVRNIKFIVPPNAIKIGDKDINYSIEKDELFAYPQNSDGKDSEVADSNHKPIPPTSGNWKINMKIMKGARFFMPCSATTPNGGILHSSTHFVLNPEGNLRRYITVRDNGTDMRTVRPELFDAMYVRFSPSKETKTPIIKVNPGFWREIVD